MDRRLQNRLVQRQCRFWPLADTVMLANPVIDLNARVKEDHVH